MNTFYKIMVCLLCETLLVACSNQFDREINNIQTFNVNAYTGGAESETRTVIDPQRDVYHVNWEDNDKIALFSDDSSIPARFTLISGANTNSGIFAGQANKSETYTAVYPFEIVRGEKELDKINVFIDETQIYRKNGISANSLIMYACGKPGSLNFYNLGSIIQLQLKGTTMLKSVTFLSNDNTPVSGDAVLDLSNTLLPKVNFKETGSSQVVLYCDGVVLEADTIMDMYIVVPNRTYEAGFTLLFDTYSNVYNVKIEKPITFERSQIRKLGPITIEGDMPAQDLRSDKQLWYKTVNGTMDSISNESAFDANIVSHTYSGGWGIISFDAPPTRINDVFFNAPQSISELYLPRTIEHIGGYAFSELGVNEIHLPESLYSLGGSAFTHCNNVKEIEIPEGVRFIGVEAFGWCSSLEYMTFPSTLELAEPYVVVGCDNLVKFKGDTKFISSDGRSFFTNVSYGYQHDFHTLDKVAGVGLETYILPDNVLHIQNYALSGCKDLKTLTLHSNIKSCGTDPFPLNGTLKVIYVNAPEPPTIKFDTPLKGVEAIYVPKESVSLYQTKAGWSDLKELIRAID